MKLRLFTALAVAAAVAVSTLLVTGADAATPDVTAAAVQGPGVTPNGQVSGIQVDDRENKIVATLRGVGKQVYDCKTDGSGYTFREPIAELFTPRGVPAAIHGGGPFWANVDGSRVNGASDGSAASSDPAKNVPWLRLKGTPVPNTTGLFSNVTFIQRIDTRAAWPPLAHAPPRKPWRLITPPTTSSGPRSS